MTDPRKIILFIDDEEYHMRGHAKYLSLKGFEVIYVSSFDEAFQEAKANLHLIDLIILDIMIPIEDACLEKEEEELADGGAGAGLILYDRIRKLKKIKTLVLTVRNDIEDEVLKKRQAETLIVKPISPKYLLRKVNELLQ